jgi:hypothetical protein
MVGGPYPGINKPVAGTVVATRTTGLRCEVGVGPDGTFTMHVVSGTYTFTGHSPSFGGGKGLCTNGAPVKLTDRPTNSRGFPPRITVICPVN